MNQIAGRLIKSTISETEMAALLPRAQEVYNSNFGNKVWFERSIFINWTCAIADCKYCYLSTKPKFNPQEGTKAFRSVESILAEVLICKLFGWEVGYITGGLRVESAQYLIDLIRKINTILGKKIMMNFGPYSRHYIEQFAPHISGMGSAIESFNEELHNFICPSKPLRSLLLFLEQLQELKLQKIITIILGLGEKKEDVSAVIENVKKYQIEKAQLCFLKPQAETIFNQVPSPNPRYMAWWIAQLRIACPQLIIKVALVRDRLDDVSLYLKAGANCFSRFMVLSDFASPYAQQLEKGCKDADRDLIGEFNTLPSVDLNTEVNKLPFEEQLREKILVKAEQYYARLKHNLGHNSSFVSQ